jgi:hypothetical protein
MKGDGMRGSSIFFILWAAIQPYADSIDTLKAKLDGSWEWVETSGGFTGKTYTPQSEHYSLTLVLSKNVPQLESDSIGYQVFRNDSLILSGIAATTLADMQAFGPGNLIRGREHLSSDTLLLDNGFIVDGYISVFVRSRTSVKSVHPLARAALRNVPPISSFKQFTLAGRRINSIRHCALPGQILASRQHAAIMGIGKK